MNEDFNKDEFQEILNEILLILKNNDKLKDSIYFSLALLLVISFLKEEKLLELKNINYQKNSYIYMPINEKITMLALKKIINMTYFIKKENNLIAMVFSIFSSVQIQQHKNINLNIFLELEYKDKELKLFGYLSSLVDETIHMDKKRMNLITKFLLSDIKENKDSQTIEYTLNILKKNNIKSDLAIELLFEMYKCIKKDSIESCLLASQYENYFKDVFENRVIEFED